MLVVSAEQNSDTLHLLHPKLIDVMLKYGYKSLTRVQLKSIPVVMRGYNTLIVAPTGSGKTEAALFPIISKMLAENLNVGPLSLIYITPLRALNRDLMIRLIDLCRDLNIKVQVRHGDTPPSLRKAIESDPPHILITTPETFQYLLVNRSLRTYLRNVKWVVIDEFHELLSSKRGAELIASLERLELIAGRFQRIALSASIGDVDLAKKVLAYGKYVYDIVLPYARDMDVRVVVPVQDDGSPVDKAYAVLNLMSRYRGVIVFTNTRDEAEYLGIKLRGLGANVYVHHGSLSRSERERVESDLKGGRVRGVVATSSLELGIDVGYVDAVIQSSSPRQAVKLLQRVGRSMHREDLKAVGYVVTDYSVDDILESLVTARRAKSNELEGFSCHENPLDVLAHIIVGLALQEDGISVDRVYDVIRRSYIFKDLTYDQLTKVIDLLSELSLIKVNSGVIKSTGRGRLYYLTTTMITDSPQYDVIDMVSGRHVGHLDEEFIALEVNEGSTLVLGGRLWRVVGVDEESRKVYVEEFSGEEALIPSWAGETIPVDPKVAREVCALRKLLALNYVPNHYKELIDYNALKVVTNVISEHLRRGYPLPTEGLVLTEVRRSSPSIIVIHACLGTKANRGLSYLLGSEFSHVLGLNPVVRSDPYRVMIQLPTYVPPTQVEYVIKSALRSDGIRERLRNALRKSTLYKHVLINILKRLGVIPSKAPLNLINSLARRYEGHEVISEEVFNEIMTRYVDINTVVEFIRRVESGRALLKVIEVSELSPLALEGLKIPGQGGRVLTSHLPKYVLAELIKRRLLSKRVRLICMMCGYSTVVLLRELPDVIKCPKCGVRYVGVSKDLSEDVVKTVLKGIKAGRDYKFVLSEGEKEVFMRLKESADLVLTYGKRAVIALTAYGIGPESAKKILATRSEEEFYTLIYEYERRYVRTRKFWD